jgi:hypothetical protein
LRRWWLGDKNFEIRIFLVELFVMKMGNIYNKFEKTFKH